MNDSWRKLLIFSLVCYALAFGLILLSSIFAFSLENTLEEFQWGWIMAQTWSEFLVLAPVTQAWAVLITFSLVIPIQSKGLTGTSFERFGSSIITLLMFTLAFSVVYGIAHPRAANNRATLEFSSDIARSLWGSAQDAIEAQDYERALIDLDQYVGVVGESDEAQELMRNVRRQVQLEAARRSEGEAAEARTAVSPVRDGVAGAQELMDRAQAAHVAEDFSTAHYLATLALSLDKNNDEAARLAASALQRLAEAAPDKEEVAQAAFFGSMQEAKESLDRGDVIHAYDALRELQEQYPTDGDVARYLAIATEQLADLTFFMDDVQHALELPGTTAFAFINASDESTREIVFIGKLVRVPSGLYAQHIEVIRFTLDGRLEYQLSSDYGKFVDSKPVDSESANNYFVLTVLDPDNPVAILRPTVHHGMEDPATENRLRISPSADELWLLAVVSADPAGASITDLVRTAGSLQEYGLVTEPIEAELLFRLSLPFTFLILSILVLGFSWRYRSRYLARPPLGTFIVVPLAPVVLLPAYLLLQAAHRILFSALLLWAGFTLAIVLLVAVEGILLAVALMYLALSVRK
ncbi:MAG: hypothetical protein KOO61_07650 [Spirochaetales bacterium]|nr:hypothetical protein [Spirochaetales bacterium]